MKDFNINTPEAAEELNTSRQTIVAMIKRGTIKAYMVKIDPTSTKGVYKIPYSEIERIKKLQKKTVRVE